MHHTPKGATLILWYGCLPELPSRGPNLQRLSLQGDKQHLTCRSDQHKHRQSRIQVAVDPLALPGVFPNLEDLKRCLTNPINSSIIARVSDRRKQLWVYFQLVGAEVAAG